MDWLLGRYAQAHLAGMSDDELEQFERLIQQPDPTLQAQIMAASSPDDGPDATSAEDEFGSLIRRIRAHHGIGETAS